MSHGKRRHPTESLGIRSEINTIHAFGRQGNETSGWPYQRTSIIGTPVGPGRVYREPRLTQDELGGKSRRRRRKRNGTS